MPSRMFVNDNPQKPSKIAQSRDLFPDASHPLVGAILYDLPTPPLSSSHRRKALSFYRIPNMYSVACLATKSNPNRIRATIMLVATTTFIA